MITFDFETRAVTDLKARGRKNYMEDPTFRIVLIGYKLDDKPTEVIEFPTKQQLSHILQNTSLLAHNALFEVGALDNSSYQIKLDIRRIKDTMVQAQYFGVPPSLAEAAEFLKLPFQKQTIGKELIKLFTRPIPDKVKERLGLPAEKIFWEPEDKPKEWASFKEYVAYDVETTYALHKALPDLPEHVWREWQIHYNINTRGVGVDVDFVSQAIADMEAEKVEALETLKTMTSLANPASNAQMKSWLATFAGIEAESLTKDTIPVIIENTNSPYVKKVLELYSKLTKTSTAKYQKFLDLMNKEHKIYDILNFYGARTGRWSSWGVQLHNMKRIGLDNYEELRVMAINGMLPMVTDKVIDTYSHLTRTALHAAKGKKFIVVDFSQIEARVLQWLAQDFGALDVFKSGKDFYTYTAANMFNIPFEQIDKKSEERRKGKVATLALGYGGGPAALERSAAGSMSDIEKQDLVNRWRKANSDVVKFWWNIDAVFKKVYNVRLTTEVPVGVKDKLIFFTQFISGYRYVGITLPSGRSIYFPDVRVIGKDYMFYGKASDESMKADYVNIYGGFLAENITQAIARDCLEILIEKLEARSIPVVFHVHDEVIIEVDKDFDNKEIVKITKEVIYEGLPLSSEPAEGVYYDK